MNTFLIALGFTLLACMMLVIFARQEHIKNELMEIRLKQNIIDNKINNLLNKNNNIKY